MTRPGSSGWLRRGWGWLLAALVVLLVTSSARADWAPPVTLSGERSAESSEAAIGPGGQGAVVWVRNESGYTRIIEARLSDGEGDGFGPSIELSDPPRTDPYRWADNKTPAVAVDGDGRALFVWGHEGRVRGMILEPGASTAGARFDVSTRFANAPRPGVGFDGDGWATAYWDAVWPGEVYAATRPPSGSFTPQQKLFATEDTSDPVEDIVGAVARGGSAVVAWRTRFTVMAAVRDGRGRFDPADVVAAYDPDSEGSPNPPQTAISPTGDVLVVWHQAGRLWVSRRPTGGTFETPVALTDALTASGFAAAFDRSGRPTVYAVTASTIAMRQRRDDGTWAGWTPVVTGVQPYGYPQLAADAGGGLYFAWRNYYDNSELLGREWATSVPAWTTEPVAAVPVSDDGENVWPGSVAAGPAGRALVTWSRGTFGSGFDVEAAWWRPDSDAPAEAPTGGGGPVPAPSGEPNPTPSRAAAPVVATIPPTSTRSARSVARQIARSLRASRLRLSARTLAGVPPDATVTLLARLSRHARAHVIARGDGRSHRWRHGANARAWLRRARLSTRPVRVGVRVTIRPPGAPASRPAEHWLILPPDLDRDPGGGRIVGGPVRHGTG